ncbi:Uncharacterised protein [Achromobacter xylosoxidans]|nr:Uncharacterised protein [Achromobacter xylosoxidans]CUJ34456.1 Uncharacterised protein [Achromobacter xylosoxidans]
MNDAMVAPVPGRMPRTAPMALPRAIGMADWRMSPGSGRTDMRAALPTVLALPMRLTLAKKSASPNRPIASATNCTPSLSSRMPKA